MLTKILCVDDDAITLMLCKKVIAKAEFASQIETSNNGEEALMYFENLKKEKAIPEDATWDKVPFYNPKPSVDAPDGYKDRISIHEVLQVSLAIKELILKNAVSDEIEKQAKSEGMMTMLEDGIYFCVSGVTSMEEVLRVVSE